MRLRLGYPDNFFRMIHTIFNSCRGSNVGIGIRESTWVYDSERSDVSEGNRNNNNNIIKCCISY